jgi:hypothetical protein
LREFKYLIPLALGNFAFLKKMTFRLMGKSLRNLRLGDCFSTWKESKTTKRSTTKSLQ